VSPNAHWTAKQFNEVQDDERLKGAEKNEISKREREQIHLYAKLTTVKYEQDDTEIDR